MGCTQGCRSGFLHYGRLVAIPLIVLFAVAGVGGVLAQEQGGAAAATGVTEGPPAILVQSPAQPPLEGIWLNTPFPALTLPLSDKLPIALEVENRNLPPWPMALSVSGLPDGWRFAFEADGAKIAAVSVGPDKARRLSLSLEPPSDAVPGRYPFIVRGTIGSSVAELPIDLELSARETPRISLQSRLDRQAGRAGSTFRFPLMLRNEGGAEQVLALIAGPVPGIQVSFFDPASGAAITSVAVPGRSGRTIEAVATAASGASAGAHRILLRAEGEGLAAEAPVTVELAGEATLDIVAADGRVSTELQAGRATSIDLSIVNRGSAPASNVALGAAMPDGWNVVFSPDRIADLPPGVVAAVSASISPPERTLIGDYVLSLRAEASGSTATRELRAEVRGSAVWSLAGLGAIAAAVLVLAAAVARFGRR
jgi:uncharacterized membrane protein